MAARHREIPYDRNETKHTRLIQILARRGSLLRPRGGLTIFVSFVVGVGDRQRAEVVRYSARVREAENLLNRADNAAVSDYEYLFVAAIGAEHIVYKVAKAALRGAVPFRRRAE